MNSFALAIDRIVGRVIRSLNDPIYSRSMLLWQWSSRRWPTAEEREFRELWESLRYVEGDANIEVTCCAISSDPDDKEALKQI